MLKKIVSCALSFLVFLSFNAKAYPRLPAGHVDNLIGIAERNHWNLYKEKRYALGYYDDYFKWDEFYKDFYLSYFMVNKGRRMECANLIRRLFEAELSGKYFTEYYRLLKEEYKENESVQLALEEIDAFLGYCSKVTIDRNSFNSYGLRRGSYFKICPELRMRIVNMSRNLQNAVLRLEVLRSLYYFILNPAESLETNKCGTIRKSFFCPWIRGTVWITEDNYHRIFSNLLILRSFSYINPVKKQFDISIKDLANFVGSTQNELFLYVDMHTFSELLDSVDSFFAYRFVEKFSVRRLNNLMIGIISELEGN